LRKDWQDPNTWEAALAACRARYPLWEMAIDGAIWSFLDTGAGDEALLLLPGAMGFADTSFHFVLAFAPQMRVISVGYPATVTDGDRLVDGLAALLTARGVAAAHVVGGSYSGLVAQRLAERHPTRVCALILANTWAPDPARARWFRPAAWLVAHTPGGLLQRFMARYVDRFLTGADAATVFWRGYFAEILPAFTPALVASRLAAFASLDCAGRAGHGGRRGVTERAEKKQRSSRDPCLPPGEVYTIPVLLVESRGDHLFGNGSRRALRRRYPQAKVVTLDCPGHAAALTHVEEYVRVYRDWMMYEH
jgi:pimeloyl-ACP methyl ester carboxylesterase